MSKESYANSKWIWFFAGIYCLLIFVFLSERSLNGFDPANYYLAIKYGFSVAAERPHAPGSPFFVLVWQQIVWLFAVDPHTSLILLNDIFLCCGLGLGYAFVRKYWGYKEALLSVILVASNPVVLYYGAVGEVYAYDLFFSVAVLYLVLNCSQKYLPIAFLAVGIAMGFRLSSVVLLAPAIAFAFYSRNDNIELWSFRKIIPIVIGLVLGICLWVFPFYISSGGIGLLLKALHDAGELDSTIYQNAAAYLSFLLWSVNIGFIVFIFRNHEHRSSSKSIKILLWLWVTIPTSFFILEHYAKGYILLILWSFIIPIAVRIASMRKRVAVTVTVLLVIVNLSLFFFSPFIPPSVESTLPKSQRSSSERLQTAFLRSFSFFAPTYAHIKVIDQSMAQVNAILATYCHPLSFVIIDNSAGMWSFPRSLQALHSDLRFVQINSEDTASVTLFSGSNIDRAYPTRSALSQDTLYYLIDPRYTKQFGEPPNAKIVESNDHLSLYVVSGSDKNPFWRYFSKRK